MYKEYSFNDMPEVLSRIELKLNRMERQIAAQKEPSKKKFLSIKDLSELTGWALQTIYGKVSRREIPFIKKGRNLYFEEQRINAWIMEGEKEPIQ
jgi:excisionase family DNA binding protein